MRGDGAEGGLPEDRLGLGSGSSASGSPPVPRPTEWPATRTPCRRPGPPTRRRRAGSPRRTCARRRRRCCRRRRAAGGAPRRCRRWDGRAGGAVGGEVGDQQGLLRADVGDVPPVASRHGASASWSGRVAIGSRVPASATTRTVSQVGFSHSSSGPSWYSTQATVPPSSLSSMSGVGLGTSRDAVTGPSARSTTSTRPGPSLQGSAISTAARCRRRRRPCPGPPWCRPRAERGIRLVVPVARSVTSASCDTSLPPSAISSSRVVQTTAVPSARDRGGVGAQRGAGDRAGRDGVDHRLVAGRAVVHEEVGIE